MNRRTFFGASAGIGAAGILMGAPRLPDVTLDESKAKLTKEAFGDLKIYFDGPTDQLKAMTAGSLRLKPGMSPHPPHQHPGGEIMVVHEGSGRRVVPGKVSKGGTGNMMYWAGNKLHGITNTGKAPVLFYFYKLKG